MADETRKHLTVLGDQDQKTSSGNYFVANYPPFSLWSADQVGEALDRLGQPAEPDTALGLYAHIPFCRKRCHFCYFRVYTDKNSSDITQYMDAMIEETASLAKRPFVAGRELDFVYFGGGTPSYLSTKQLGYLFDGLKRSLSWEKAREVAFECEPGTLNEKKLRAIRDFGVTRLSLGIENLDDKVLEANNRAHRTQEIYSAYEWARSAGFPQINIDLIAGMLGETEDNWHRCVGKTIELSPDAVTIYQMEVPHNTTISKQMRDAGNSEAPVADWATKRRWVSEAFDALEAAGYTIGSAYTAVKDPQRMKFVYRDALWNGADMLGVGVSSFGHLGGVHCQNQPDLVPYLSAVAGGELPISRALRVSDEQLMIRQFILQLKLGRLDAQPFVDKFGVNVADRWADVLQRYQQQGYLEIHDGQIELTRAGLLCVDGLLPAFFLPEHQEVRYA